MILLQSRSVVAAPRKTLYAFWILATLAGMPASATEAQLKPATIASFDRYIRSVEARMDDDIRQNRFLIVDHLSDPRRQQAYEQLQQGHVYIEELRAREGDRPIHVPSGRVHHWAGLIFVPKATLPDVIAVLQDYDNHYRIYKPQIRQSKLIEHNGGDSKIYLQLCNSTVATVVLNAYFDVIDTPLGNSRHQSASRSTRIAEVANPGEPSEHERPIGKDHGYMWRLYSYWRLEEKDGGVYVQNESVALGGTSPALLAWLVNPLTKNIPHNILLHLLTDTRNAVVTQQASPEAGPKAEAR